MLELARGIRLRVDVGDLLQLQCAFERDGIVDSTPEEERVVALREALRPCLDLRLEVEGMLDAAGHITQLVDGIGFGLGAQAPLHLRQREAEREQRRKLRGERLGGCHADLRAGARVEDESRCARDGALAHVADRERRRMAKFLRPLQGLHRVQRLARLGDRDDELARIRDRLPVAILVAQLHVAGDLREPFEPVARHQSRVEARPRCEDEQRVDAGESLRGAGAEEVVHVDAGVDHAFERVGHGARLLVDLLLHVVPVGTQVDRIRGKLG